MRKKELKLIVTFHTTADAIAVEKACKEREIPGRMIPGPRELSAGCGLAWCMAPEGREKMEGLLSSLNLESEEMAEILY